MNIKSERKEETNDDLKFLRCAFSYENAHFVEKPIQLSCNHCACDTCFTFFRENTAEKQLECTICRKMINLESNSDYSLTTKNLVEYNFDKLTTSLKNEFKETFKNYKSKLSNVNNFIDLQVHYAKNEVNIRANLLKNEIEEIKTSQHAMLDKIKDEFSKKIQKDKTDKFERLLVRLNSNELIQNQESFYKIQSKLGELKRSLNNLESLNSTISLNISNEKLSDSLIGKINYSFEDNVEKLNSKNLKVIDLDYEPVDLCILPNNNLLISSTKRKRFTVYDANFIKIKTIDKINGQYFTPRYFTTNGLDKIYFSEVTGKIIETDLDFKFIQQFGSEGSGDQELDFPNGIVYYENSIYVCDCENKRIQKLSDDLIFQQSFKLNFKPWKIQIFKGVACIRPDNESYITFFNMYPFYCKVKITDGNGDICLLNSLFYEYNHHEYRIRCYNINGQLLNEKIEPTTIPISAFGNEIIQFFNGKILIGLTEKKKMIVVS